MSTDGVRVLYAARVAGVLRSIGDKLRDLTTPNREIAADLVSAIGPFTPTLSGRLAGTLAARASDTSAEASADTIYAGVINYGGYHGITGALFLQRGLTSAEQSGPRTLRVYIDQIINRST